ncbi:hypothetical protein M5C90_07255 [Pseudomonas chlororaphis subsp. piscium]|nr:hypothetical protein M5C90_07255 [Pseudomonas chlororaphis subsp. piscium]
MGGHSRAHPLVARIFGDEDFADRRAVEAVETLQRELEQVQTTATGDHQRDVTLLTKLHLILTYDKVRSLLRAQ